MKNPSNRLLGLLGSAAATLVLVLLAFSVPAGAATKITQPSENPIHVALDANGQAVPFTVTASGFPFRAPVFLQQCDGRPPTSPQWSPAADCDIAASRTPVNADAKGVAEFDANNSNRALKVFVGPSPQGLFNCLPPHAPSPKNGLPDFEGCYIRVATDPAKVSSDQIMVPIVFGSTSSSSTSNSTRNAVLLALIAILLITIVVFAVVRACWKKTAAKR